MVSICQAVHAIIYPWSMVAINPVAGDEVTVTSRQFGDLK
jgi:hypothetical protein